MRGTGIVRVLTSVVVVIALVLPCVSLSWTRPAPVMAHGCHGSPAPRTSHACCHPKHPLPASARTGLLSAPDADSLPELLVADAQDLQLVILKSAQQMVGSPPRTSAVLRI